MEKYVKKILLTNKIQVNDANEIVFLPKEPYHLQFVLKENINNIGILTEYPNLVKETKPVSTWDTTNTGINDGGTTYGSGNEPDRDPSSTNTTYTPGGITLPTSGLIDMVGPTTTTTTSPTGPISIEGTTSTGLPPTTTSPTRTLSVTDGLASPAPIKKTN